MQFDEIMVIVPKCAVIVIPPKCVVRLYKYVQLLAAFLLLRTPQSALTCKRLKTRVWLSRCPRRFCSFPLCVCCANVRTVLMACGHGTKKLTHWRIIFSRTTGRLASKEITPGQFVTVLSLRTVQVQNKNISYGDTLPHTVVGVCGEFQRTGRFLQRGI